MFLTTRGLILRETPYKEADKILTVLTESEGKLTCKARGVMRSKSKLSAATQLLCFSELTLFENKGKWSVNEAVSVEEFRGLRDDISLLALGSYFAELLEAVSDEDAPDPSALRLGLNCLYALSLGLAPTEQVKAAFELRLMCLTGYEPDLSCCRECGESVMERAFFLPAQGALYCEKCKRPGCTELPHGTLAAMRHIISADMKRLLSFILGGEDMAALSEVCEDYVRFQLERGFGSLDYYKKVSGK